MFDPEDPTFRTVMSVLGLPVAALSRPILRDRFPSLPESSVLIPSISLIVAGTPCAEPMFCEAVARIARVDNVDILLVRTGLTPHRLGDVICDVVVRYGSSRLHLRGYRFFYTIKQTLWLVASDGGPAIKLDAGGLTLRDAPPCRDDDEYHAGLDAAARQVIRVTQNSGRR